VSSQDNHNQESESLGFTFWAGLMGVTLACGIGLMLAVVLFGLAWHTWGIVGAAIALIGVATGVKYLIDRRARQRWS
jgi:Kef-type K+ transport system membrane component KefB